MHTYLNDDIVREIERVLEMLREREDFPYFDGKHPGLSLAIKTSWQNRFGEIEPVLLFAQVGWPDAELPPYQAWACLRLAQLRKIIFLEDLTPTELVSLVNDSRYSCSSPEAGPFALIHAVHPGKYTCYCQPISILSGNKVGELMVLPFETNLPSLCRLIDERAGDRDALVLSNRGLLTGGPTLKDSLSMIKKVAVEIPEQSLPEFSAGALSSEPISTFHLLPELRARLCELRGRPLVLHVEDSSTVKHLTTSLLEGTLPGGALPYPEFFTRTGSPLRLSSTIEDVQELPDESMAETTIILHPDLGFLAAGNSPAEARRAAEYFHNGLLAVSATAKMRNEDIPDLTAVRSAAEWEGFSPPERLPYSGEIALVTGAASGIGKAVVAALLERGSAVAGVDIDPGIQKTYNHPSYYGIICDVASEEAVCQTLKAVVNRFGGLDMLILNAGLFPSGCNISKLTMEEFTRVINVNFTANMVLMREAYPLLSQAPRYGRVVVIGSKNMRAPGPGAAAYSTSKAALTQLARVAALEWGNDRIRVNIIHPDSVFDTALYTPEVLQARASHYGLSVEQYKKRNLLKTEITSHDVAELVAEMCGPLFQHMTGGQIQFDGGNDRTL